MKLVWRQRGEEDVCDGGDEHEGGGVQAAVSAAVGAVGEDEHERETDGGNTRYPIEPGTFDSGQGYPSATRQTTQAYSYLKENQTNTENHNGKLPLRGRKRLLPTSRSLSCSIMTGVESVQLCILYGFRITYIAV